jgi:methionyl-tRNA formyltransferase
MMTEAPDETTPGWRIVLLTNIPGGVVYSQLAGEVRSLGHRIVGVLTSPGPKRRRSDGYLDVVASVPPGVDVIVSNHPARWATMIATFQPDLLISCGFPWRIPAEVIGLPRLGAINFHDALLPRYRGPNATGWAFRNGDTETALTIHRLTPDFDAGAILAQERIPITDDDNFSTLDAHWDVVTPVVLRTALERIARGEAGEPQDETLASEAGLFEEAWRQIDWTQPARTIHNQVRSWIGWRDIPPCALGEVAGKPLRITRTQLLHEADFPVSQLNPGTVLYEDAGRMVVQCGDSPLALLAWTEV